MTVTETAFTLSTKSQCIYEYNDIDNTQSRNGPNLSYNMFTTLFYQLALYPNTNTSNTALLHHIYTMCKQTQFPLSDHSNQLEGKHWLSLLLQSSSSYPHFIQIITRCNSMYPSVLSSHSKHTMINCKTSNENDIANNETEKQQIFMLPRNGTEYAKQSAMNEEHHRNHHQNNADNTSNGNTNNNASNEQNNPNNNDTNNNGGHGRDDGDEKKNNDSNNDMQNNNEEIEEKKQEEEEEKQDILQPIDVIDAPLADTNTSNTLNILKALGVILTVAVAIIFGTDFISIETEHDNAQLQRFYQQAEDFLKIYDAELLKRETDNAYKPYTADIPDDHPTQSWLNALHIGSLIDALDVESKWYTGYITNVDIKTGNVKVHYDDWPTRFDEWVDPETGKLAPYRTHAIGGQAQGGLPGRPLLPIKPDNGALLTPFQKMRLSLLRQQTLLPDITVSVINTHQMGEYKTVFTPRFYDIGIIHNDRAMYMNEYGVYIYYSSKASWCIGMDVSEKQKAFICIQSDALRPELIKPSKQSHIRLQQVIFAPAYLLRGNKPKYTPIGKKGLTNIPTAKLNNNVMMPLVIVGTAGISVDKVGDVINAAGKLGYYMYDTGTQSVLHPSYFNHEYIHNLFKIYGRATIGVSTKIPPFAHGYQSTMHNFFHQLNTLGTDYIDLVLIEHPDCIQITNVMNIECEGHWLDTWRALELLYEQKRIRALGVSQFSVKQLNLLIQHKQKHIPLSVVRDWRDPLHPNKEVFDWCVANDVQFQAFSPLGGQYLAVGKTTYNPVLNHETLKRIATKRKMTPAQLVIKWNTRRNVGVVLRTEDEDHLWDNLDSFSFGRLTDKELRDIDRLTYVQTNNPSAKREPLVFQIEGDSQMIEDIKQKEKERNQEKTKNKPNRENKKQGEEQESVQLLDDL